jgi:DNA-binding transcriptional LysR family regulator
MRTEARRPTFRQLEAFHAVMTGGSMKAAAETLFISQAAVSKLIASLEEDLGLSLFESKRGGLRPSEAGQVMHQQTRQLFGAVWKLADLADKLRDREAGRLRIAAMSTLSVSGLPRLLA